MNKWNLKTKFKSPDFWWLKPHWVGAGSLRRWWAPHHWWAAARGRLSVSNAISKVSVPPGNLERKQSHRLYRDERTELRVKYLGFLGTTYLTSDLQCEKRTKPSRAFLSTEWLKGVCREKYYVETDCPKLRQCHLRTRLSLWVRWEGEHWLSIYLTGMLWKSTWLGVCEGLGKAAAVNVSLQMLLVGNGFDWNVTQSQ